MNKQMSSKNNPYQRHNGMWSPAQQRALSKTCVAIGGVGGVGAAQALLLAKTGIGRIRIADRDSYEIENIVEQAFATWDVVGRDKVVVAKKEMKRHNDNQIVESFHGDLSSEQASKDLVSGSSIVFSGVDNPSSRIALGRAALETGVPFVVGANVGWSYFYTIYLPERGGYAAAFASSDDIAKDNMGFPVLADNKTRKKIERDWCMWTVTVSGFRRSELRRFIAGKLDHFSYAAGPAFAVASVTVTEGLKLLLGIGSVVAFPEMRLIDMKRGEEVPREILNRRFNAVADVWELGASSIFEALKQHE